MLPAAPKKSCMGFPTPCRPTLPSANLALQVLLTPWAGGRDYRAVHSVSGNDKNRPTKPI